MVEIEHDGIGLATVDAWMRPKIVKNVLPRGSLASF